MAKKVKRVVESTSYPLPNDLWLDTSGENPVLKTNQNGEWITVSGSNGGDDTPSPSPSFGQFSMKFKTDEFLGENNNFKFEDGHGYYLEDFIDASEQNLGILNSILDSMTLSAGTQEEFPDINVYEGPFGGRFYYVSTESGFYGEMGDRIGIYPTFNFEVYSG